MIVPVGISLKEMLFLHDHRIGGEMVLPGVFLMALVQKAFKKALPQFEFQSWEELNFLRTVTLGEGETSLFCQIDSCWENGGTQGPDREFFRVLLYQNVEKGPLKSKREILKAKVFPLEGKSQEKSPDGHPSKGVFFQNILRGEEKDIYPEIINLGPNFRVVKSFFRGESPVFVSGKLNLPVTPENESVLPGMGHLLREGGFQLAYYCGHLLSAEKKYLPGGIEKIKIFKELSALSPYLCQVHLRNFDGEKNIFDVFYYNPQGELCEAHWGLYMWKVKPFI